MHPMPEDDVPAHLPCLSPAHSTPQPNGNTSDNVPVDNNLIQLDTDIAYVLTSTTSCVSYFQLQLNVFLTSVFFYCFQGWRGWWYYLWRLCKVTTKGRRNRCLKTVSLWCIDQGWRDQKGQAIATHIMQITGCQMAQKFWRAFLLGKSGTMVIKYIRIGRNWTLTLYICASRIIIYSLSNYKLDHALVL